MVMTNHGFNGTVDEAAWARMSRVGQAEGVDSPSAWAVTQGTGRQVSCAAQSGWAFAAGVESKETAALTANLTTPVSGGWFLVVRRINWSAKTVTLETIAHDTTSTTIPAAPPTTYPSYNQNPGVLYDQPLAWAWCRSSDTTVVVFDLRKLPLKDRVAEVQNAADLAELIKYAPVPEGRRIHVDELNCDFQAQDNVWVQAGVARFASTGARDTAYAKASGVFLVAGVEALDTSSGITYRHTGSAWMVTPPALICDLRRSAAVNVTSTPTAVAWDVEVEDVPGWHSTVTNPSRVVVDRAGWYEVTARLEIASTSVVLIINLYKNGVDIPTFQEAGVGATGASTRVFVPGAKVKLAAGDYLEVLATAGSTVAATVARCYFQVRFIGGS